MGDFGKTFVYPFSIILRFEKNKRIKKKLLKKNRKIYIYVKFFVAKDNYF